MMIRSRHGTKDSNIERLTFAKCCKQLLHGNIEGLGISAANIETGKKINKYKTTLYRHDVPRVQ